MFLACNTSHVFLDEVRALVPEAAGYVVDMIALLAKSVADKGVKRAFLLASEGTIASGIYQNRFGVEGVKVIPAGDEIQERLRGFIELVKQNMVDDAAKEEFAAFVCGLSEPNVILGCTELPLLVDCPIGDVDLLDPMQAAIDYVVRVRAESKRSIW